MKDKDKTKEQLVRELVHRIENITSNIGKIEFPFIDIISYEIMDKNSQ